MRMRLLFWRPLAIPTALALLWLFVSGCSADDQLEKDNPVKPIPVPPVGIDTDLSGPLSLNYPTKADKLDPRRIRLGRWLFHDRRVSVAGDVACSDCHMPQFGYSNRSSTAMGSRQAKTLRKVPSLVNIAWRIYPHYAWDGKSESLEQQVVAAILNPLEMGNAMSHLVENLSRYESYLKYFEESYGSPKITGPRITGALAAYQRTFMSGNSAWDLDRWEAKKNNRTRKRSKGEALFFGKAGCDQCHKGSNLTDHRFHNSGVGWNPDTHEFDDEGRYNVTRATDHKGHFKTPTLRDVAKHPPYMHDGSMPSLFSVLEHYNAGGSANPGLSPEIQPLALSMQEMEAVVLFLESLNGPGPGDQGPAYFPQ